MSKIRILFPGSKRLRSKISSCYSWQTVLYDCNIADNDVCFCRVMNQLAGVNIHSSVGMFTMPCESLTYAESFGFLLSLHIFFRLSVCYVYMILYVNLVTVKISSATPDCFKGD